MSGPDYPRLDPGSNEIGRFRVGVHLPTPGGSGVIGTLPAFDVWTTILSQYANSNILTQLIESMAAYVDPTRDLDSFFDLIWNVDTAEGYGLDVWGRIVGVNRVINIPDVVFFGFKEGQWQPFNQAPFYSGATMTTGFELSDKTYRTLIFAKALANISANTIPTLNQMLLNLFPNRGNCYVTEGSRTSGWFGFQESVNASGFNQDPFYSGQTVERMQMTYTFEFPLSSAELAIVTSSGVLPKPTGVLATVVQL